MSHISFHLQNDPERQLIYSVNKLRLTRKVFETESNYSQSKIIHRYRGINISSFI